MKELRDLKALTIHDAPPISDEQTTGRRHSLRECASGIKSDPSSARFAPTPVRIPGRMPGTCVHHAGLHVTGKYRTKHDARMLQACGPKRDQVRSFLSKVDAHLLPYSRYRS